jgi:hypothetical protein
MADNQELLNSSTLSIDYIRLIRLNEKDFFHSADDAYRIKIDNYRSELQQELFNLESKKNYNKEIKGQIIILRRVVNTYYEVLQRVISLYEEKGFCQNEGLLGILNKSYSELLEIVRDDVKAFNELLQIRELQKDYQLNLDPNIMNEFSIKINTLQKILEDKYTFDKPAIDALQEYKRNAYKLYSMEENIRLETEEFNKFINTLEPQITYFMDSVRGYINLLCIRAIILSILTIFILISFIFALNAELFKSIPKEEDNLAKRLSEIKF